MPKGRMLAKKISQDERIAKLSLPSTLLYTWCIPHLDQAGRMFGDIWTLKSIVPHIKELTPQTIQKCVKEWVDADLVYYYGNGNLKYIEFKGFLKNQTIHSDRESPSVIPGPSELMSNSCVTQQQYNTIQSNTIKSNSTQFTSFCDDVVSQWNTFCDAYPVMSKVKELNPDRISKLKVRYERESFRNFGEIISALKQQSFCRGGGKKGWKATFDWIIANDTNYTKVLEMNYKEGGDSVPDGLRKYINK